MSFQRMSLNLRNSMFFIGYVVFCTMLAIGLAMFAEDYTTSVYGYQSLPTRKANEWVIYMVALAPQVGSVGFLYAFIDGGRKNSRFAALAIGLMLVDVVTDVIYKAAVFSGGSLTSLLVAIPESIVVYSLFSELFLVVGLGFVLSMTPRIFSLLRQLFSGIAASFTDGDDSDDDRGSRQPSDFHGGQVNRKP